MAWMQLIRLPNLPTAFADVLAGCLITHGSLLPVLHVLLLVASSASLYVAGMILNDVYDLEQDAYERPSRPLPSGRIRWSTARWAGLGLLVLGLAFAWTTSYLADSWRVGLVAVVLAGCVWGYDAVFKSTPLGPVFMGACRGLNILLGMSLATGPWQPWHWQIACGMAIYVAGVTWLARTEASRSSRLQLGLATCVIAIGLALLASLINFVPVELLTDQIIIQPKRWYVFWILIAMSILWRCGFTIANPEPATVQAAVKQAILALIILNAACVFAFCGLAWALVILALLVPTVLLGLWLYST